ncbi:MAG TPA: NAD-dependent epimerase/dehydratase family protein [Mycobacteriales bacterium]|nr:NAD-dependent epimerase/dehydratase family protein [Mycobacteriales bacterium]
MDVLVLGGTSFVGRAVVDALLTRGHSPTLFTRGITNPDLFPDVLRRRGDRDAGDYASLDGSSWDAVVDVSAYHPRHVGQAIDAAPAGRYLFISTVSVYDVPRCPEEGLTEDAALLPEVRDTEEVTNDTYGGLKVACETDLRRRLGDRATIVRPGIVAGPHDTTDRFTYWARRASQGGRVALPGRPEQPVQVIDSRDLANLCAQLLEDDRLGTFNAVGPAVPVSMAELIATCAQAGSTTAEVVPVPLVERTPPFPLVLDDPNDDRMFRSSSAAARAVGLTATSLLDTALDTAAWDAERGAPPIPRAFTPEQEQAALAGSPVREAP